MEIFEKSKALPGEERYSLTDQIRRSSRSVAANISKLADADGEASETQVWLDFARECGYLSQEQYASLIGGYEEVGRMLGGMITATDRSSTQQGEA